MLVIRLCAKSVFCFVLLISSAAAQNTVVVIPMAGDDLKPLANIVTVATANGDFSDPIAAIASITDASVNNPYLLVFAPGVYDIGTQQFQMKPFVDVTGSGENVTKLTGSISSALNDATQAFVLGADNSRIQHLTIENINGVSDKVTGIYNGFAASSLISNVTINLSGTITQTGIYQQQSSNPISDVTITVSGGGNSRGIISSSSTIVVSNAFVNVSGTLGVYGIQTDGGTTYVRNSNVSASGGSVRDGAGNNSNYISDSILTGPVTGVTALRCSFVFTHSGGEYASDCTLP